MSRINGTKCDGCGKEVDEKDPRGWVRCSVIVLQPNPASAVEIDFCSNSCGMRYWTHRVEEENAAA